MQINHEDQPAFYILITPETQPHPSVGAGAIRFTGFCSPDGYSEASRDGFMASREMGGSCPGFLAED